MKLMTVISRRFVLFLFFLLCIVKSSLAQEISWEEVRSCLNFLSSPETVDFSLRDYEQKLFSFCPGFQRNFEHFSNPRYIKKVINEKREYQVLLDLYFFTFKNRNLLSKVYPQTVYEEMYEQSSYNHESYRRNFVTRDGYIAHTEEAKYPENREIVDKAKSRLGIIRRDIHDEKALLKASILTELERLENIHFVSQTKGCVYFLLSSYDYSKRTKLGAPLEFYIEGIKSSCGEYSSFMKSFDSLSDVKKRYFQKHPDERVLFDLYSFSVENLSQLKKIEDKGYVRLHPELKEQVSMIDKLKRVLALESFGYNIKTANINRFLENFERIQERRRSIKSHFVREQDSIKSNFIQFCYKITFEEEEVYSLFQQLKEKKYGKDKSFNYEEVIRILRVRLKSRCFNNDFIAEINEKINLYEKEFWEYSQERALREMKSEVSKGEWNQFLEEEYNKYSKKLNSDFLPEIVVRNLKQKSYHVKLNQISAYFDFVSNFHSIPNYLVNKYNEFYQKIYSSEGNVEHWNSKGRINALQRRESCYDIKNDDEPFYEKEEEQGNVSWCGSYAVSDLLSQKAEQRVSILDIAHLFYERVGGLAQRLFNLSESFFTEDFPSYSRILLSQVRKHGVCLEKDLPFDEADLPGLMRNVEGIQERFQEENSQLEISEKEYKSIHSVFVHLKKEEVINIIKGSKKYNVFDSLIEENCRGRRVQLDFDIHQEIFLFPSYFKKKRQSLDEQLNQGRIILAGITRTEFLQEPYKRRTIPEHYLNIVGRRFNKKKNRCEYLIKNSYKGCLGKDNECQGFHTWLPEADLGKILFETSSIK